MGSLLRIFIIALLFFMIAWVIRGLVRPAPRSDQESLESELVADSLTGVYFDRRKAITVKTDGKTYYFMNSENRDAWLRKNFN
ncbi:MAG: hypothetical protein LBW85_00555 [Deltaproteobacteria bacterium]|jgi:hypothetical protein|nr:hypothetical protein [Deltaproteobacteria bacterium]